ncbi:CHC2 zinc finger domain-containing protein [bacterium]|nr:CHC2 zinc finger domain-containing protein [bacterium]
MHKNNGLKAAILQTVSILDLAENADLNLEEMHSSNFSHRCRCPNKHHKSGSERTPSLYINSKDNNFYCYGCQASYNCIDFYMLCKDCDFSSALKDLSSKINYLQDIEVVVRESNYDQKIEISRIIKVYLDGNKDDLSWVLDFNKKIDEYIEQVGDSVEKAKKLKVKVDKVLKKRQGDRL